MELADPTVPSPEEEEIRKFLLEYPVVRDHIIIVINLYRRILLNALEGEDPSDVLRSLIKNDHSAQRLGIPFLETFEDWLNIRERMTGR